MSNSLSRREFLVAVGSGVGLLFTGESFLDLFGKSKNRKEKLKGNEVDIESMLFTEFYESSAPLIINCNYKELLSSSSPSFVEQQIKQKIQRFSASTSYAFNQIADTLRIIADRIREEYPQGDNFCFIFTSLSKPQYCRVGNVGSIWEVDSASYEGVSVHEMFTQEMKPEKSVIYSRNGVATSPNAKDTKNWTFYSSFSENFQKFPVNGYIFPISLPDELGIRRTVVGTTFEEVNGESHVWKGWADKANTEITILTETRSQETGIAEVKRCPVYLGENVYLFASMGDGIFLRIQKMPNFAADGYYADLFSSSSGSFFPLKDDAYRIRLNQMLKQLPQVSSENITFSRRRDEKTDHDLFVVYQNSSRSVTITWIEGGNIGAICSSHTLSGEIDFVLFKNSFVFSRPEGGLLLLGKNLKDGKYYELVRFDKQQAQLMAYKEHTLPLPNGTLINTSG